MKSYSDITLKYLKKNKKRTLFTVIGIIMSLSLISGIGFLGLSFKDFMYNRAITYNGDYEFFARNLTKEQALLLKNDVDLEKIAIDSNEYNNFIYNQNDKEASGTVIQGDKEYFNVFYKNLEEGRAPESSNEIILGLSEKEDFNIKLGEKFEVDETYYDQDYNVVLTGNKKEYTVVGFYTETAGAYGDNYIIGVTLLDTLDSEINYNVAFTVIDKENKIQIAYDKISKMLGRDLEFEDMSYNNDLLALRGQSSYSGINTVIIGIFIFVLAVIIFATIFLIYNAINISVTERMSQFGILRSIGASPKQVRNLVLKEGLLMCLMAIPFGVLCGYLGIWVTVKILGVKIGEMFSAGAFTVSFKLIVIIFTAIIGSLTILIASFGPAKKAGKINPIDIIKGNNDNEKVKNHVIGSSIIRKIFGVEGWIAYKNIRKNSKRFMVTILSLSISLIMFITFTTLNMKRIDELNYLNEATLNQGTVYIYEKDQIDVIEEKVKAITGVNKLYGWFENSIPLELDSSVFTEEFKIENGTRYQSYVGERVSIEYFNNEILKKIGIEDGLKDNEIILMNSIAQYNAEGKLENLSVTNLKEGDTLKIPKTC
ncbi:MAG: FtsX-like permease family protein, partial [Clostridium celatum]|nr:FtsX-like permease family protein [Clostridium celatum]